MGATLSLGRMRCLGGRPAWRCWERESETRAARSTCAQEQNFFSPLSEQKIPENAVGKPPRRIHNPSIDSPDLLGNSSSPLLSWTVQPSFEVIPAQPQLVFLHPAIPPPINRHLVGEKRSDSTNYLPILNSYTKTAPHPCKRDRVLDLEERGETSGQKWLCTDTAMSSKTSLLPSSACTQVLPDFKPAQDSTQRSSPALMAGGKMSSIDGFQYISTDNQKASDLIPLSPTGLLQTDCTSHEMENPVQHMVQFAACNAPLAAEELYTTPELLLQQQSKRKRFQNTMVVLHRSGLLEITLKTKELIHQNQVTQIELDRLKQQTQLFMEAIKNNAPQAWAELEASLTGSDKADSSLEASPTYPNM